MIYRMGGLQMNKQQYHAMPYKHLKISFTALIPAVSFKMLNMESATDILSK